MPTLGPFFKWLRPNHWKHVAIEPQLIENSRYGDPEALERVWPRPSKKPSDDTLLDRSAPLADAETEGKTFIFPYSVQAHQSRGQKTPERERLWVKPNARGSRKGSLRNETELQKKETGSQSTT